MSFSRGALVVVRGLVLFACFGCGSDKAVPITSIAGDKKLVDLSADEVRGVCQWGEALAHQKLPPGTSCFGSAISFGGCITVGPECPATVAEWQQCMPALLDRLAQDPCKVLDLAFSQSSLASFIEDTSGCEGLGPCGTTMVSGH